MSEQQEFTFSSYLGVEFQQRLMWQLLVEPEFAEKVLPELAIEYFDDPNYKRLFIIILEFYKEFGKVPNLQNKSIHQAIAKFKTPNNQIEEETLFTVVKKIELWNERVINKQLLHDGDIVQKSTSGFIKQQEYRKLAENIIVKVKNGEIKNKFEISIIEEKFQKISHIGEEEDDCEEVTEGIDKALMKEFRKTIPTGIDVIDGLTGGGLGKGEIGLILTASGVGKSTLLTKIANTAFSIEKNVAHIIFEDTKDQIKRKHYTIWAQSALSRLDEDDENERVKEIVHRKAQELDGKGRLVIKRFSQENTTMMDIRNWMIGYQKKYGFKFELLVLDYLDCLESHKKNADRNEAELTIVKSFEALAADFDIPGWSAIQSNRSGFGAEFVDAQQTGGSIKRLQKAHFFMSVSKTKDQQEAQLANIRIIKARFAQDGQTFQDCIFNNDTMEIRIEDDRYKFNKMYTGKKYDENDVNRIEGQANVINEISSDARIHMSISKANSENINNDIDEETNNIVLRDMLEKFTELNKFENKVIEIKHNEIDKIENNNLNKLIEDNFELNKPTVTDNNYKELDYFDWNGESGTTTNNIFTENPTVDDNTENIIEIIETEEPIVATFIPISELLKDVKNIELNDIEYKINESSIKIMNIQELIEEERKLQNFNNTS